MPNGERSTPAPPASLKQRKPTNARWPRTRRTSSSGNDSRSCARSPARRAGPISMPPRSSMRRPAPRPMARPRRERDPRRRTPRPSRPSTRCRRDPCRATRRRSWRSCWSGYGPAGADADVSLPGNGADGNFAVETRHARQGFAGGSVELGRYRLEEQVGQGGMAVVWRGWDTQLRRTVAVKVLHAHLHSREEIRKRFDREAHAVARLHHPYILDVYDFSGPHAQPSYLVTEFIRGQTLRAFADEHPFDPPELAAACLLPIAEALQHAHAAGVVHRDLKHPRVPIPPRAGNHRGQARRSPGRPLLLRDHLLLALLRQAPLPGGL